MQIAKNIARKIYYFIPPELRLVLRKVFYLPHDLFSRNKGELVPPRGMIYTGSGDFIESGKKIVERLKEFGGLNSESSVLDIGSGIGRIAIPLNKVLDPTKGIYEGFDLVSVGVNWCKKNISTNYKNFNFKHVQLLNDLYTSKGMESDKFEFPYEKGAFDVIIVNSVFTHMLPKEVENYLEQISKVLKPGGSCMATFFILNSESKAMMIKNDVMKFKEDRGHYALLDAKVKSANVAFEESYLDEVLKKYELRATQKYFGYWPGRKKEECKDFQDVYFVSRTQL